MKKIIALMLLLSITITSHAQKNNQEKVVKIAIENFFKGFHKGDTILLKKTIHKDIIAQTTFTTKKGNKVLRTTKEVYKTLLNFAKNVKPTDDYNEKIGSYIVHVD